MSRHSLILAGLVLAATPGWAFAQSAQTYEAELDPTPFDATTRAIVIGAIGQVSATLDGNRLTVTGRFSDLTSPATAAGLRTGLAKGVPGDAIGTLTVTHDTSGSISGSVTLGAAQLEALNRQSIYVRVDSQKAPDGNLQGWLEPANGGEGDN
ncbi:MAG: CHRD domain-containing protein [Alphaproteobacteria bacterium]|nr:CHRD domain-containing protein [Alphaproteobacteria bacterium]